MSAEISKMVCVLCTALWWVLAARSMLTTNKWKRNENRRQTQWILCSNAIRNPIYSFCAKARVTHTLTHAAQSTHIDRFLHFDCSCCLPHSDVTSDHESVDWDLLHKCWIHRITLYLYIIYMNVVECWWLTMKLSHSAHSATYVWLGVMKMIIVMIYKMIFCSNFLFSIGFLQIVKKDRSVAVVETSQACLKIRTCLVFMALLVQRSHLLLWTIYAMMETMYQRSVVGVVNGQVDSPLTASVNKHYYAIDPGQLLV